MRHPGPGGGHPPFKAPASGEPGGPQPRRDTDIAGSIPATGVAPWLAKVGDCASCDRRRATGAAEARKQREKARERRARQKETL